MNDEQPQTDQTNPTPEPWPLTGEPAPSDQPDPSEVLPIGGASEVEHLRSDDDAETDTDS